MGNVPTTAKQEMQAELANGTLVNITEEYNIQGQLLSTNVAANFLLMPSLTVDCVLGMDFLTEYNCTIDIGTKQITINPKTDRVYPTLTIEPPSIFMFNRTSAK